MRSPKSTVIAIVSILPAVLLGATVSYCVEDKDVSHANSGKSQEVLPNSKPVVKAPFKWLPAYLTIDHGDWHVTIKKDGSGDIYHGAVGNPPFRPKTFDVQAIDRELQPHLSREPVTEEDRLRIFGKCYGVTYYTKEEPKGTFYYTGGPVPIARIFERFKIACRTGAISPGTAKVIEKSWRKDPPTPVSKPWDAKSEASNCFLGGYLWLLEYEGKKHGLSVEFQNVLKQLKSSKVPTRKEAEGIALAMKSKAIGLLTQESAHVVSLVKSGVDSKGFVSHGDLIWIVQMRTWGLGVSQEAWINAKTGSVKWMLPMPEGKDKETLEPRKTE